MNTVKCVCGKEILVLPDAEAMSRSIEVHVDWHVKKSENPACATFEAEQIRDALISQIFSKACEIENKRPSE